MRTKRILVAPLNWGLGHATRCIPIIKQLKQKGFSPLIASDGAALLLLQKEFPEIESFELPSYNIRYTNRGSLLKWKLLIDTPGILKNIKREKKATKILVEKLNLNGIISDSRFGVRHKLIPNVFITHQLNVLSGNTTYLSSKLHQQYIKKYGECWIPDAPGKNNLSGILGHSNSALENTRYLGILSRFQKQDLPVKYDFMVLLSGPEPQRSLLEKVLLESFQDTEKNILFVRGVLQEEELQVTNSNLTIHNYLYGERLEKAINSSEIIIARSGYTTIMDLAKLEKKAFFIPTPGQFEQEYLAGRLLKMGIAASCSQDEFRMEKLKEVHHYSGLSDPGYICDYTRLFSLF